MSRCFLFVPKKGDWIQLRSQLENAAQAVTAPEIIDATRRYAEVVPFPGTSARIFPSPDFYTLAAGATLTLPGLAGSRSELNYNDFVITEADDNFNGLTHRRATLVSVSVPSANSSQLTATMRSDGSILVTPAAGFTGVTYFDYVAGARSSETQPSRVYIRVK